MLFQNIDSHGTLWNTWTWPKWCIDSKSTQLGFLFINCKSTLGQSTTGWIITGKGKIIVSKNNLSRDILQEIFENISVEMNDENSEEENEWGSGGEFGDGWGPSFGEGDGSDEYNSAENESHVTKAMIFDAFEKLGLGSTNVSTKKTQKGLSFINDESTSRQRQPDELSQQKAKELSQRINLARDILQEELENPDWSEMLPVWFNESCS